MQIFVVYWLNGAKGPGQTSESFHTFAYGPSHHIIVFNFFFPRCCSNFIWCLRRSGKCWSNVVELTDDTIRAKWLNYGLVADVNCLKFFNIFKRNNHRLNKHDWLFGHKWQNVWICLHEVRHNRIAKTMVHLNLVQLKRSKDAIGWTNKRGIGRYLQWYMFCVWTIDHSFSKH